MERSKQLFRAGILGTTIAAVCCATPILALLFGALGVSAWLSAADYVVIPALAAFVGLTAVAAYRMHQARRQRPARTDGD